MPDRDPAQCCGECKWLSRVGTREPVLGNCIAPLIVPDSITRQPRKPMFWYEGKACPCFERRPDGTERP